MNNIDSPIFISSMTGTRKSEGIYYNILHIAEASSWYHRQPIDKNESQLFELFGSEIDSVISKNMEIHIDDKMYVYMVNKNYSTNGICHTKTHLMVSKNFNIFDDLFKLDKQNFTKQDLINIQIKRNSIGDINMLFMLNISARDDILNYNLLNYELNIYKYLQNCFWLGDDFTTIIVYDIYENDVTTFVKNKYNELITGISETPTKKRKNEIS